MKKIFLINLLLLILTTSGISQIRPGESANYTEYFICFNTVYTVSTSVSGTDAHQVDVSLNYWLQDYVTKNVTANITIKVDKDATVGSTLHFTITYSLLGCGTVYSDWTITVLGPEGIRADFVAKPTTGVVPLNVQFTDKSTGEIDSWSWDFGDGMTSSDQNPIHEYTQNGFYTVLLDASGPDGSDSEIKENYITVTKISAFREIAHDPPNDALQFKTRDVYGGCDLDQDGKKEILLTDYLDGGKVHVYEFVEDNTIELVWSSNGTASTDDAPARSVKVGDLDSNGKEEILLAIGRDNNPSEHGLHVFEWDGINDNNYGNGDPIAICPVIGTWTSGSTESIAVEDLDGDGKHEVVYLSNGGGYLDGVFILSCTGEFSQGNISWVEEANFTRGNQDFFGNPISTTTGDLDNDDYKEAIVSVWDDGAFLIIESTGIDQYTNRLYFKTTQDIDDYCCKNIIITDFDHDNTKDILFNLSNQAKVGVVHNISNLEQIPDSSQITFLFDDLNPSYGMSYKDQDSNGEKNLFLALGDRGRVVYLEYVGSGDRLSDSNYEVVQAFEDTNTSCLSGGSFAIHAPDSDLDGDGFKEFIVTFLEGDQDPEKVWFRVFEYDPTINNIAVMKIITPDNYILNQNYPNPFNPSTKITFTLPKPEHITLTVFNTLGQKVAILLDTKMNTGSHDVQFDASALPSGIYFYRIQAGEFSQVKKMVLLK